jgi:uncharacterized iron-regulated membrane protein
VQQHTFNKFLARQTWLKLHLYLALSAGLIFVLIGFTGSISIYREALDELLNPQLVIENPQSDYQSLDRIMDAVRSAHPDRHGEWTLEMPNSPHSMMTAWFEKPRETYFERYAPLMVSINPYTADIVDSRFWGQTFTTWLLDLHTQLLMGDTGWNIVGWCGLLLPVSVLSGLYLWWPGITRLSPVFSIRLKSGLMLFLLDLHRLTGLVSAPVLFVLALTGVNLSFPGLLEGLSGSTGMAHGATGKTITSTAQPNDHPTLLEAAEFIARGPFPDAEVRRVTTPDGASGVYRVNLRQKTEINRRHPYTTVWVDRWSSQIKEVRNPAAFGLGERLITWMWPLHTGEMTGKVGRFVWFLSGQSLFFLYISGLFRWLCRTGKVENREFKPEKFKILALSFQKTSISLLSQLLRLVALSPKVLWISRLKSGWLQVVKAIYQNTLVQVDLILPQIKTGLINRSKPFFQTIPPFLSDLLKRCVAYALVKLNAK